MERQSGVRDKPTRGRGDAEARRRKQGRASHTSALLIAAFLFAVISVFRPPRLSADDAGAPVRFRESVAIETNLTAQRQLELARVHLADKHWKEAVDLIRQVTANDSTSLVSIAPGRYLNVAVYAQLLLAALPPEGLAIARKAFDDSAREAVSEAIRNRNDVALRAIVRDSFIARASDEALSTLGQWAWELGDFTQARGWWERQLPLGTPLAPGTALPVLRYPDTQSGRAEILARLVMCSVVAGDGGQAALERSAFRRLFPDARGELGGREGKLADRLDQIAAQARSWKFPPLDTTVSTFGINAARNGVLPRELDVGAERWAAELSADPFTTVAQFRAANSRGALSLFPVVYGNILLVSTADQILAWNLRTGKPAWPDAQNENHVVYPNVPEATPDFSGLQVIGAPRYTLTVADGRLFARLGTPVTARSRDDIRESDSQLVCLDLEHGQGKLVWKIDAATLDPQLAFEGSPLVTQGRAYVAARKGRPQMQTQVFCFESQTGRKLWDRAVCAAVANPNAGEAILSHQLLTAGDDAVFLATGTGAVAAIEAAGGALRWVVTYESNQQEPPSPARDEKITGPCLFTQNIVVAAPSDFDAVLAIDSRTGTTLWQRSLPGGIEHLIGCKDGILIASGASLWGIELSSGRVLWHRGYTDPVSRGYGRGVLAGNVVYWPTREEIFVFDQASGELQRRIPLLARYAQSGGNLILAGDALIVAQPQRIAVYGTQAGPGPRSNLGYTQTRPENQGVRRVAESVVGAGTK